MFAQFCSMTTIRSFTFNPVGENTYVIHDEHKNCVIIDPGCYFPEEEKELAGYIESEGLKPLAVWLTHAHFDHILGGQFVCQRWGLEITSHSLSDAMVKMMPDITRIYNMPAKECPLPAVHVDEGMQLQLGTMVFDILHCPGHSVDSIVLVNHAERYLVGGDVLFAGSIGRTDLPGGDHQQLLDHISRKLFTLPADYTVHCGHGESTTIGFEKAHNPFFPH